MTFELTLAMAPGWAPVSTAVSYEQLVEELGEMVASGFEGKLAPIGVLQEPLGEVDRAIRSVDHRLAVVTFLASEDDLVLPIVVTFMPFDHESDIGSVREGWAETGKVEDVDTPEVQGFVRSSEVTKSHSAMFGVIYEIVLTQPAPVVVTCFAPDSESTGVEYLIPLLSGLKVDDMSAKS